MLRLQLHRIWAVCTKKYPKTLKHWGFQGFKGKLTINSRQSSVEKHQICTRPTPAKCRRRPFSVVEKLQMQMCLMDYFKRLETYLEMKTERFTAVKRSVFV